MINVSINRNSRGQIYGFVANNHGKGIVCAAVSALVLNAVNAIESFTDETISVDKSESGGGYIKLLLPDIETGKDNRDVDLLLSSMLLGLENIRSQYPAQISINDPNC